MYNCYFKYCVYASNAEIIDSNGNNCNSYYQTHYVSNSYC